MFQVPVVSHMTGPGDGRTVALLLLSVVGETFTAANSNSKQIGQVEASSVVMVGIVTLVSIDG